MAISLNLLGRKNSQVIGGAIPKDYLRLFKEDLENSQDKLQDIETSRKSIVEKYQDLYFVVVDLTSALETTVNYLKRLNRW